MKNSDFEKLSKAEKRIAIAKDVLAQLQANRLKVVQSTGYCMIPEKESAGDLREVLKQKEPCTVCGIGALFVAEVKARNRMPIKDLGHVFDYDWSSHSHRRIISVDRAHVLARLKGIFTETQLDNIEEYFESYYEEYTYYDEYKKFGRIALKKIMENIIANKGRFTLKFKLSR